jgi:hypothetical protein
MLTESLKTGLNLVYDSKLNVREIKAEANSMPTKLRLNYRSTLTIYVEMCGLFCIGEFAAI